MPLDYVDDDAFSGVMVDIGMEKLSLAVDNLPNNKAHCGEEVLVCLLKLLNLCLSMSAVLNLPIALIEIVHKILSKILSNQISLTCSKFNVLHGNNFLVLKGTLTQSPIFAIGSVVKDALKKNRKLWLVLQDILLYIKICEHFIQFFGNIYGDWLNRMMTNFGLLDSYKVHNELDQGEYRIDSRFVAKFDRIEVSGEKIFFLAVGAFVDDTIWYILNIASEFFVINDILINNDKMVAISINRRIKNALLLINGVPILIAKKAHKDVKFFSNIVLKKAIMDKQFCYLVLAVLQSIVSYRV
ncbi:hypothetical protein G9A89_010267 [Geosiphon pyriformis]|nr:hypothetical protein G9A89_010267 [Geosiphon pyriformis]